VNRFEKPGVSTEARKRLRSEYEIIKAARKLVRHWVQEVPAGQKLVLGPVEKPLALAVLKFNKLPKETR
jgi:hypothetical protein